VHSLSVFLIVAVSIPFAVFVIAFIMSRVMDWGWRSGRNRAVVLLATGALYLAGCAVYLWNGEPWPMGAFFAAGGVVWAVAGFVGLARATGSEHKPAS
jgi:hypothetical protein